MTSYEKIHHFREHKDTGWEWRRTKMGTETKSITKNLVCAVLSSGAHKGRQTMFTRRGAG